MRWRQLSADGVRSDRSAVSHHNTEAQSRLAISTAPNQCIQNILR